METEIIVGLITLVGTEFALVALIVKYFIKKDETDKDKQEELQKTNTEVLVRLAVGQEQANQLKEQYIKNTQYIAQSMTHHADETKALKETLKEVVKSNKEIAKSNKEISKETKLQRQSIDTGNEQSEKRNGHLGEIGLQAMELTKLSTEKIIDTIQHITHQHVTDQK